MPPLMVPKRMKAESKEDTGMTTCPCGFTLQPHQKFCPNCGAKVTHDEAPTLYPQYQTPPAASDPTTYTQYAPSAASGNITRSEERRVGKECRSRWSPY